jgi:hypothetical protein
MEKSSICPSSTLGTMPKKKIAETKYYDAMVVELLFDHRWVRLEIEGLQDGAFTDLWVRPIPAIGFRLMQCPDEYHQPKVGDRIKLAMRHNPRHPNARQTWEAVMVSWIPERYEIHDVLGYDS